MGKKNPSLSLSREIESWWKSLSFWGEKSLEREGEREREYTWKKKCPHQETKIPKNPQKKSPLKTIWKSLPQLLLRSSVLGICAPTRICPPILIPNSFFSSCAPMLSFHVLFFFPPILSCSGWPWKISNFFPLLMVGFFHKRVLFPRSLVLGGGRNNLCTFHGC